MAERSLSERVSLALQEQIYSLAASVSQSVDEVLGAVESVVKAYEDESTPAYVVNINGDVDVAEWVHDYRERNGLPIYDNTEDESGGRDTTGQPLSREELLREVYRYNAEHSREAYLPWAKSFEDAYASPAAEYLLESLISDLIVAIKDDTSE